MLKSIRILFAYFRRSPSRPTYLSIFSDFPARALDSTLYGVRAEEGAAGPKRAEGRGFFGEREFWGGGGAVGQPTAWEHLGPPWPN